MVLKSVCKREHVHSEQSDIQTKSIGKQRKKRSISAFRVDVSPPIFQYELKIKIPFH